jgi:hypothetical protein
MAGTVTSGEANLETGVSQDDHSFQVTLPENLEMPSDSCPGADENSISWKLTDSTGGVHGGTRLHVAEPQAPNDDRFSLRA